MFYYLYIYLFNRHFVHICLNNSFENNIQKD